MLRTIKAATRPVSQPVLFQAAVLRFRWKCEREISPSGSINTDMDHSAMARALSEELGGHADWKRISLTGATRESLDRYYQSWAHKYCIDQGRGKALEHAIGMEIFDFSRVAAYCDVASAESPLQTILPEKHPQIEFWIQDLQYETNFAGRRIGGSAAKMKDVPDGYFDALTLHNSFEHFSWNADSDFIQEVDRVLSSRGACLILPLYVAATHRIYFDPRVVTAELLESYDAAAALIPVKGFAQRHARFYSPRAITERLLSRLPGTLRATVLEFSGGEIIAPTMYPEFALVLHRSDSILRDL